MDAVLRSGVCTLANSQAGNRKCLLTNLRHQKSFDWVHVHMLFFFLLFFVLSEQLLVITVFISAVLYKVKGFSVVKEFPANVIGCSVSLELESACVHVLW